MLATILVLAREPKENREAVAETTTAQTTTAQTTTAPAPKPPAQPTGDAAAGKQLFASKGCGSCHTFRPAGASGTVGPDLDNLAADAQKANRGSVQEYAAESIENPSAYVVPGYPDGVMPNFGFSKTQVNDLVAFLTQS